MDSPFLPVCSARWTKSFTKKGEHLQLSQHLCHTVTGSFFFLSFFFCSRCLTTAEESSLPQDCMRCTYLRIVKQNSTRGLILTVTSWVGSDETSPVPEIEGMRVTVPRAVTHVLLGWRSSPLRLPPPTTTSTSTTFSLYLTVRERNMLAFYALHSLLVPVLSLYHCSISAYQ